MSQTCLGVLLWMPWPDPGAWWELRDLAGAQYCPLDWTHGSWTSSLCFPPPNPGGVNRDRCLWL